MFNFITLFNKNYLSRGLTLYNSLVSNCSDFCLYILTIDNETEEYFIKNKKNNIKIISLHQLETFYPELQKIKKERTKAEYCWTLTPFSIQYAIITFKLDSCTYIDSDIYFFSNPKILFDDAGDNSIIITEHRYSPKYDQTETNGKYCVQFMFFKNDIHGNEALEWWRLRCKEWCYARNEDGKFGDQKYLDDWITRFKNIYVPNHIGCGIAPWNMNQYEFYIEQDKLFITDKITKEKKEVIFFHYHNLKQISVSGKIVWDTGNYSITDNIICNVYKNYINKLKFIENNINILYKINNIDKIKTNSFLIYYIKNIIKSIFFIKKQYLNFKNANSNNLNYIYDEDLN